MSDRDKEREKEGEKEYKRVLKKKEWKSNGGGEGREKTD